MPPGPFIPSVSRIPWSPMRTRLVEIDDASALMNILNPEVVEAFVSSISCRERSTSSASGSANTKRPTSASSRSTSRTTLVSSGRAASASSALPRCHPFASGRRTRRRSRTRSTCTGRRADAALASGSSTTSSPRQSTRDSTRSSRASSVRTPARSVSMRSADLPWSEPKLRSAASTGAGWTSSSIST